MEKEFDRERIEKYYNNNYTEPDEDYVTRIFNDKKYEDDLKSHLLKQFYQIMNENISDKKNLVHILYKIHYKINTNSFTGRKNSWAGIIIKWTARIAAVLFLSVSTYIGINYFDISKSEKLTWTEIKAPAWTRVQFSLPNGTKGWLNSNSSIKYRGNFYSNRQISLKGEAYFDVYKNKDKPFVVYTDEVTLKVLGTKFNIASYSNENHIEVVLEDGEMIFKGKGMENFIKMKPNDLINYDKSLKDLSMEVVQPKKFISWTEGKLVFRNDPLDMIARRLARWYNIDVEVNGTFVQDLRLRATFKDESLEEVLGLLQRSLNVKCKIVNGNLSEDGSYTKTKVIITSKNN